MPHRKTQAEWENEMSVKILDVIHQELYLDLRYMEPALSSLVQKAAPVLKTSATDGTFLYYSPAQILRVFQDNPKFLGRAYLHGILHCIFAHLWLMGSRERGIWNIACDIAVEYAIDGMDKPCTGRALTWIRQRMYDALAGKKQSVSAAVIYQMIRTFPAEQMHALQEEFYTDDHCFWPTHDTKNALSDQAQQKWGQIARQSCLQKERHGSSADDGGALLAAQIKAARSRRNYRDFLKKFSILREELHCSPDEFDLNYYTYGLRLYGNLPLIEPLETREIRKIQEFVIVVDTSDSTSGSLVKNFLRETFRILHQREHFFTKCQIRILQCDDRVRTDQKVSDIGQFEQMLGQFTVIGGGGTDFRPAFSYVDALIEQGTLKNPGGLLYFTDGEGIYPKKRPSYRTAFLFLEDYNETAVPPWAIRLKLEPEEFMHTGEHFTGNADARAKNMTGKW